VAVYDALDALTTGWRAEVHQQSKLQMHETKIRQKLLAVDRSETFHRFEFDQELPFDKQVGSKPLVYGDPVKDDGDWLLTFDGEAAPPQAFGQDRFIDGFEQSRS
jgi:hypothetical protein